MNPIIIIDSDDYAAAGIKTFFFPGGEPHCRLPESLSPKDQRILLFLKLRTWNDVGLAAVVIDALERRIEQQGDGFFSVFAPYWPGARQDRSDGLTPFTLDFMCRVIGRGTMFDMSVFDPHSDAIHTRANVGVYDFTDLDVAIKDDVVGIIAPDLGARRRAKQFHSRFYPQADFITCDKKRDFTTGAFLGYNMPELRRDGRYIIVDDICDGGGTFNLLAESFKRDPISHKCRLELFVSHGIFSKGLDAIDPIIECITTTNSWCNYSQHQLCSPEMHHRLHVLKLEQLFPRILGEPQ